MTVISALAKLIGLGIKGWKALDHHGFDEKDLVAIQGLMETGASLASMRTQARRLRLSTLRWWRSRSFGRAGGPHQEFHGKLLLSDGLRRWLSLRDRQQPRRSSCE